MGMAMATASVERLEEVPARLAFLFEYAPERTLADARVREEMLREGSRAVVMALADELAGAPRVDREKFRAVANQVRARTGQSAKALFHPIRIALTGRAEGPELDLAIPSIDRGPDVPPGAAIPPIAGCPERSAPFIAALEPSASNDD